MRQFIKEHRRGTHIIVRNGLTLLTFSKQQTFEVTPSCITISAKNITQLFMNFYNSDELLMIDNQRYLFELSKTNGNTQTYEEFKELSKIIIKAEDIGFVGGFPLKFMINVYVVSTDKVVELTADILVSTPTPEKKFRYGLEIDEMPTCKSREELLIQSELNSII